MGTVHHIDAATGKVTVRQLTSAEKAQAKGDAIREAARLATENAERTAREAAAESATTKLLALGLSADEIAALRASP